MQSHTVARHLKSSPAENQDSAIRAESFKQMTMNWGPEQGCQILEQALSKAWSG
jgi:hypothetical protein